ncbi:MAG TPA: shikimate dehydrogenase [Polyangiaceae bacterium]
MKFALLGHPVAHSLSPVIHRAAYRELGLEHSYGLIDAASEADVERALAALQAGELAGLNVTVPWKRYAFARCARSSALAERLGVANVLGASQGELVGHNTDALALEVEFARAASGNALVLGSGGATPAVVAACQSAGLSQVLVTARRFTPATPRVDWPGASELERLGAQLLEWPLVGGEARERFEAALVEVGLLVQSTSAGMHGAEPGQPLAELVPWELLPPDALAYDLIYAPLETPFLRAARHAGLRTAHGLNMLVGQAALAIEIWLGRRPPNEPLLAAALAELAARGSP